MTEGNSLVGETLTPEQEALVKGPPTQVAHPWRTTVRTVVQVVLGLVAGGAFTAFLEAVADLPIGEDAEATVAAWIGASTAVTTFVTRVMQIPQVEHFLEAHLLTEWLATGVHKE